MSSVDADYTERTGSAVAIRDEAAHAPPALFGSEDPVEIVERAVRVADALKAVVVSKKLIANIQDKEYPQVEAWLTLAAMLRLTTVCEWTRPVPDGWEARVFVRDASGAVVGAAEAQCLATERSKRSWESYALRSMAQTRATSKSLRSVLGFVMVLAGYQATPSEEMPDAPSLAEAPAKVRPIKVSNEELTELWIAAGNPEGTMRAWVLKHFSAYAERKTLSVEESHQAKKMLIALKATDKPMSDAQKKMMYALLNRAGMAKDEDQRHAYFELHTGKSSSKDFTASDAKRVIDALQLELGDDAE